MSVRKNQQKKIRSSVASRSQELVDFVENWHRIFLGKVSVHKTNLMHFLDNHFNFQVFAIFSETILKRRADES